MRKNSASRHYSEVFLIGFIISMSFLLPYIIIDKGVFLYYGDFCVQMVPFTQLMHDSLRSGNIFWSWYTDLGSNFLGSYSFYNIGSPFFWLTLPFPNASVPYLIGPILGLKFSVMALTAYAYIVRFSKTRELAVLGGLLYAFSSASIYNVFFYVFLDSLAFFPLLLIAMEDLMIKRRRGFFALIVALCLLTNYFFFVGEAIFLFLYWIFRCFSPDWRPTFRRFFQLLFESVLGVLLTAVLTLPAMLQVLGNTRLTNRLAGWNLLVYNYSQRLPDILHSVFFPQDLPAFPNFFPDSGANWSSVAAWLPLFSMTGVIAFLVSRKGHWIKRLLCTCFAFALIPGLNSVFVLFVDSYYGRWFYMPLLLMSLITVLALEDPTIDFMRGFRLTVLFTAAFVAGVGLIPQWAGNKFTQLGLEMYPFRFWFYVGIVAAGLFLSWLLYRKFRGDPVSLANYSIIALTVIVCVFGNFFIATGKSYGYNTDWYEKYALNGASKIDLPKPYDYRVDVLSSSNGSVTSSAMDNQALFWRIPTIQAFNSVISASTMEFYPTIGVTRDVASRPSGDYPGLRCLLSVRYLFVANNGTSAGMPGWQRIGTQLGFSVWRNNNYIPFGFTFTKYITENQYDRSSLKDRLLLKALLLSKDQIKKYGNILTQLDTAGNLDFSNSGLASDCKDRNETVSSHFSRDNTGFTSKITLPSRNLVFFGVPYDAGWSATVNGKPVAVEKVDVGFMAVFCPRGNCTIRFTYTVPGLKTGVLVTVCAALALGLYLLLFLRLFPRRRRKARHAAPRRIAAPSQPPRLFFDPKPESEQPDYLSPHSPPGLGNPQAAEAPALQKTQPPEEEPGGQP